MTWWKKLMGKQNGVIPEAPLPSVVVEDPALRRVKSGLTRVVARESELTRELRRLEHELRRRGV